MHFFYLDETGCTGADLNSPEQPIFVLGGVSVSDDRWRTTTEAFNDAVSEFFNGAVPENFELHATQLNRCEGPFQGRAQEECNAFTHTLIDLVGTLKHNIHFIAIDKARLAAAQEGQHAVINCKIPYLLGFNYLISYIEAYVKGQLGKSARGMIILDEKDMYQSDIDRLTRYRRFEVPAVRRIKWIVEFSYPVDSVRHPLVQLSDVVIFHVRKFLECENGYREAWPEAAKNHFASCYEKICTRVHRSNLMNVPGAEEENAHAVLAASRSTHRLQWRRHYGF
jgi:Protein of unknown function (DUF3800)